MHKVANSQEAKLRKNPELDELKQQIHVLKKQLKESQTKRNMAIRQLSQAIQKNQQLENELSTVRRKSKEKAEKSSVESYKVQQLHFLNRELNTEIESLRAENEKLLQQLRHSTQNLEIKYQQLERNTLSKIDLAIKRIKKTINYLNSLSGRELEKTRISLVQNLQKSLDLLKGRHLTGDIDEQVDEMMSPFNVLQEQASKKDKQLRDLRQIRQQLEQSLQQQRKINNDIIPQYKQAVQKLKKSLQMCRTRIAELENQKQTQKTEHSKKIKQLDKTLREATASIAKLTLENKMYQGKLQQLQGQVEQQKDRIQDQNQMLKKLYSNQSSPQKSLGKGYPSYGNYGQPLVSSRSSASLSNPYYRQSYDDDKRSQHSRNSRNSRNSRTQRQSESHISEDMSQATIQNEIDVIDQQIADIQKTLAKQLSAYNL